MTRENLEKEAEDFLKKSLKVDDDEFDFFKNEFSCKEEIKRLTDFVEPREKRIAELEAYNEKLLDGNIEKHNKIVELQEQIEKMKLCQNCKFEDNDFMEEPCRDCSRCLGDRERKGTSDKWEIKND